MPTGGPTTGIAVRVNTVRTADQRHHKELNLSSPAIFHSAAASMRAVVLSFR